MSLQKKILKRLQWSATHVSWIAAYTSWITMVLSPVAYGAQVEAYSKQQLQQSLQELGLDKKSTVGEFWQKSKAYFPAYVYQELEEFVKLNKNLEMPAFDLSTAKATDGTEIPVLQSTQNGKTNRIQFFGQKNNWAKFNNQVLSEDDLERPNDIFKRLMANDIKLKNDYDNLRKKNQAAGARQMAPEQLQQMRDFTRFKGFPVITPQLWQSLTFEQRAGHVVNMRLMGMSAQRVLAYNEVQAKSKNLLELMLSPEAFAQTPAAPVVSVKDKVVPRNKDRGRVSKTQNGQKINIPDSAKSCIVAGYVGAEGIGDNARGKNRKLCSLDIALGMYGENGAPAYVREANTYCTTQKGNSFRACNPMQYSFPKGNPICIDQNNLNFQTATHRNGICDTASPLSSAKMVMEFNGRDYSNVEPASVRQKMIEDDQRKTFFVATKDFIAGMLEHGDKNRSSKLLDMFKAGKWDPELDREMVSMQMAYEDEVNRAIKSCHENIALKQSDSQQKGACDQLHRRWLFTEKFVAQYRQNACPEGSAYIGAYADDEAITNSTVVVAKTDQGNNVTKTELNRSQLKDAEGKGLCQCVSDKSVTGFKGSCKVPAVIVPPVPVATEPLKKEPTEVDLSCPTGTILVQGGDENQCRCNDKDGKMLSPTTPPEDVPKLCQKSDLWKWVLGGLGVLGLLALFFKKKNSDAPPKPPRPNPVPDSPLKPPGIVPPPPPQPCPAPKVGTYPNCACPASISCGAEQQIYNLNTCQCTPKPEPVKCADGLPPLNNDSINCPPVVPPPAPTEGGSGNNCPNGKCNSGAPTKTKK